VGSNRYCVLKRGTLLILVAAILIIAGLIFLAISFTSFPRNQTLVNSIIAVNASSPSISYGVSASHFLSGNSNGMINGSMLTYRQCCVNFYIFTDTGWSNFMSAGYNATNSTNSPVFELNSSAIDAKNGVSSTFTFVPDPTRTYELVFFNANRSLWHTNSNVTFHVIADITLHYLEAPEKTLLYPGAALIVVAVALIYFRWRYPR
jgi:hypothetical protein